MGCQPKGTKHISGRFDRSQLRYLLLETLQLGGGLEGWDQKRVACLDMQTPPERFQKWPAWFFGTHLRGSADCSYANLNSRAVSRQTPQKPQKPGELPPEIHQLLSGDGQASFPWPGRCEGRLLPAAESETAQMPPSHR